MILIWMKNADADRTISNDSAVCWVSPQFKMWEKEIVEKQKARNWEKINGSVTSARDLNEEDLVSDENVDCTKWL